MFRNFSPAVAFLLPLSFCAALVAGCTPGNNKAPRPVDDSFQIGNGGVLDFFSTDLLGNDSDPDGDTLKLVSVTEPAHGTVTPLPDGGYRYANDGSNSSSDRFGYVVEDSGGKRASAMVNISITQGPTANDDTGKTDEDTSLLIDVAANDTNADQAPVTISSSDGITILTGPANGTAEVVSGQVRYTPAADFNGNDSFTYTIADGSGIPSNPATVTVTVTPVNDPPQAAGDSGTTAEDTPLTLDVLANDSDPEDNIDPATITIVSNPAHGTAVANGGKVFYTPSADYFGSDSFTYTVKDAAGESSNAATVTVTVTPVNDGPPVAAPDTATTGKNLPVTIDILANDSDPDGRQTIVGVHVTNPDPAFGSVTVNGDNSLRYQPATGYAGTVSFSYRLEDDAGQWSNAAGVTIDVTNVAPQAIGSCSTTRQETPLQGNLTATDPDSGETLTFALGPNGVHGAGPMTTANGGRVEITNPHTGAYTYTPASKGGRGRDSFDYQVIDSSGATASATETVIVDMKIMAVGDSITSGETNVGNGGVPAIPQRKGYRQPLQEKLAGYGYSFEFVGSLDHGCQVSPPYQFHAEGWPGYTAQQILEGNGIDIPLCNGQTAPAYTGILNALNDNPADIVLLHIGTNGVGSTDRDDIAAILDDIDIWEGSSQGNHVTVVLAEIIDSWKVSGGGTDPRVTTLNSEIVAAVQNRPNDDVILVDQHGALTYPDDIDDTNRTSGYRLHPTQNGYNKMADVWLYPLIHQGNDQVVSGASGALLDKCP